MDINNYSYTGNGFADDSSIIETHEFHEFRVSIYINGTMIGVNFESYIAGVDDEYNEYDIDQIKEAISKFNSYIPENDSYKMIDKEDARNAVCNIIESHLISKIALSVSGFTPNNFDATLTGNIIFGNKLYTCKVFLLQETSVIKQIVDQIYDKLYEMR
jgi:hypothetical protein